MNFLRRILPLLTLMSTGAFAQNWRVQDYSHPWVDSLMRTLSFRDKLAQMMMVTTWSNQDANPNQIGELITKHKIGGIMFLQGSPEKQAQFTNYYQSLSQVPLFVSIDGEWGLSMRLKTLQKFPHHITLGAIENDSLICQTGYAVGLQCKALGVTMNFGPVADVNTNPRNPIIGFRSFGEEPNEVARRAALYMRGMQDAGIISVAKHFPGHGDSETDSHTDLPFIGHTRARLDSVELLPFRRTIKDGIMGVMVAHLEVPALDSTLHMPSSLSKPIVTGLLQHELGFKGLTITDALNMKGVAARYPSGLAEAEAARAGNDILLYAENVPKALDIMMEWVKEGKLDSLDLENRVRKILYFKTLVGLDHYVPVEANGVSEALEDLHPLELNMQVAMEAVTLISDRFEWLPLQSRQKQRIAVWEIGKSADQPFSKYIKNYRPVTILHTTREAGFDTFALMIDSIAQNFDLVIIGIHNQPTWTQKSRELPQWLVQGIYDLQTRINVIPVLFGNLYALQNLPNLNCVMLAYEDEPEFQYVAAKIITGELPALGKLPATAWKGYEKGMGINTTRLLKQHFAHAQPKELGFKRDFTKQMDSLLDLIVKTGAAPGGQVLVLKNGKTAYHKSYGTFYYNTQPESGSFNNSAHSVYNSDLYDLASISKVAGTTLAAMKLYEEERLKLDCTVSKYIPDMVGTNKSEITIRELLTHEAGLPAFIPFYKYAGQRGGVFSQERDSVHTLQVSNYCWMLPAWRDTMWQQIIDVKMNAPGNFLYSDLSMMILQKAIEGIVQMPLEQYLENTFYTPMRLDRMGYRPTEIFPMAEIAPTTDDKYFRNGLIQGYVHDPGAAMLGGVAGHAGLFSNAEELARIFYMLEKDGVYEGYRYFKPATIETFSKKQSKNSHRGLGFDKPNGHKGDKANISDIAPAWLFGHSGFTGTWAWADPKNDLVFIFLSNRTYPDENNLKLVKNNFRTRAFEIVYKAL